MEHLEINTFLDRREEQPILDVRTPAEFDQGHIPGAINMPLLSNAERIEVGTLYKSSPKEAFKLGLDFIGPKMKGFIEFAEGLKSSDLLVHCWRGGNRSRSVASLLQAYGFHVGVLHGGYKAYRSKAIAFFDIKLPLIVLTGYTGSLKTEVLHAMQSMGEQIVDFEGLAAHQGSAFGRNPDGIQPSAEHFQNLLFEEFNKLDLSRRIWVEDEPMRIGQVNMVPNLYHQKNEAPHVFLEVDEKVRLENLVRNYSNLPRERLVAATHEIQKKLGKPETEEALDHIRNDRAMEAARIILKYYDIRYKKSIESKLDNQKLHIKTESADTSELAHKILNSL